MRIRSIIGKLVVRPNRLFLIDGFGAVVTVLFLGGILPTYEQRFGMPRNVLYPLALVVCVYAIYSLCCYFFVTRHWRPYLSVIMIANLLYCFVSIGLVVYFYQRLTILGLLYFILEIIVLTVLILIELTALSKKLEENNKLVDDGLTLTD